MAILANGWTRTNGRPKPPLHPICPRKIPYAINRYVNETGRLYAVLNKQLADREFVAGNYSIADIAMYPWIVPYERQNQKLEDFPNLKRWFETIQARPATIRAYEKPKSLKPNKLTWNNHGICYSTSQQQLLRIRN